MPKQGYYDTSYVQRLKNIGITLLEEFHGSKAHHQLKCEVCKHEWSATPISKLNNYKKYKTNGCPKCAKERRTQKDIDNRFQMLEKLKDRFIILSDISDIQKVFQYAYKIQVKNKECNHEFISRTKNLVSRDVVCPICNTQKKRESFQKWNILRQEEFQKTASEWDIYRYMVYIKTKEQYKKNKHIINPSNLPRHKAGVEGAYHLDHIVPVRYCFDNHIPVDVCAHSQNLQMIPWRKNIQERDHIKSNIPPIFYNHIQPNIRIKRFCDIIKDAIPEELDIHSTILDPYPLTIFFPTLSFGILYCPLNEYTETKTSKYYLLNVLKNAKSKNIKLLILFEDEWNKNQDLIISKILHYANQSKAKRIYARDCRCKNITPDEKGTFLNSYHIQGNDNSNIHIGAFYKDTLVAVMTFSPPRIALGGVKKDGILDIELVRFATKIDYHVIGVASKLLKFFERNHQYDSIYSFADMRWSDGNLYKKLGFDHLIDNPPDYFYVIDHQRKHRWNYRKDKIRHTLPNYTKTLTEYENMKRDGYDRIWGCGTKKYKKARSK